MDSRSLTIRDIAKEAGVSVATVSRVLNESDRVKAETYKKVMAVIQKYDYVPNAMARSLYKRESKNIGVILPDITNHYYAKMYLSIQKNAQKEGYATLLCNSMNDFEDESLYLDILEHQRVDAVILMGGRTNKVDLEKKYIAEIEKYAQKAPLVVINGFVSGKHVYNILTDEEYAFKNIINYIVDNHFKRIAFTGGYPDITVTRNKICVIREVLAERREDIKFDVYTGGFNINDGYHLFMNLYHENRMPEVIVAVNDEVACGIMKACFELNIKIPQDLSITGYDDIDMSLVTCPCLTTYRHPYEQIGLATVSTVMNVLKGEKVKKKQVFRGEFVIRDTVKIEKKQ